MNYRFIYFLITGMMVLLVACNNTKHLPTGTNLFVGSKVNIKADPAIKKKNNKALSGSLQSLVRPKPNSKILGARVKLSFYNIVDTPKGKGLRYFIKYKLGEPPVIAQYTVLEKNRAVMQNWLENRGYFHDTVTLDTVIRNKKLTAVYNAYIGQQYTIRHISFPQDSSILSRQIRGKSSKRATKRSLFKEGAPYDLDVVMAERSRIDARLKDRGFYYFNPDYLIAEVDSTVGNHQVDIAMLVKDSTPDQVRRRYRIDSVVVFADYDINSDSSIAGARQLGGYTIVDPNHRFNPKIFTRTLIFDSGDVYKRSDHNLSLNRLTSLGVYKFVKARFEPTPGSDSLLNAYYYLTPALKKSLRAQFSVLSKTNNANGGEFSLTWHNRSLFKGAESFTISPYIGFEKQIYGGANISTRRVGVEANLYIPRIIAPFRFKTNSNYVPQTKITAGYEWFNRPTQYLLNSARLSYGYVWKENIKSEHQLNIININAVQPKNITPEFQDSLKENVTLARSIEKQFIIGATYNYNYNTLNNPRNLNKRHNFYFNGNIDLSGNLLGLVTGANYKEGKQKSIFGTPFSQYSRIELELRHRLRLGANSSFHTRLWGGEAYAYGNSSTVPFIKEFFAGGTSDIRAFRSRTLGPGSYYAGNSRDSFVVDQPGDIKLEMNMEYRMKLFSIVRGALFADAGNVWTRKEDTTRYNTKFTNQFLKQVAVGVGAGLRFDISILVLRLDVSIPIRVPWNEPGNRWVFDKIDFGSKDWRRNNIIYNLAIGYPF
jgi:outer membrane protein insertion porin family